MTWDLTSYFPAFNGPEMLQFKAEIRNDIAVVVKRAAELSDLNDENAAAWEEVLLSQEDLVRRMSHLGSYISCLASSDARNEAYLEEEAALTRLRAEFAKVRIELLRAVKPTDDKGFAVFSARPQLDGAQNYLHRLLEEARRAMTREKEILATDLGVDGIQAWGRLYDTVSAKLEFEMMYPDGRKEQLPISQRRSLMDHPDRRVRQAAFDGGNAAWHTIEDTAASALNAIAGTRLTLNRHRRVDHFLEMALFQAAITRKTLDALFEALRGQFELPRRILKLKAQMMGREKIAWFDLGAPLDLPDAEKLSWDKAKSIVGTSFSQAYPALGNFFQQYVIAKNWVDWEPRGGKRPGGFCTTSMLSRESRIFMTFKESLADMLTLAHEAGHAYHGLVLRDMRPYARAYPMTLAETASTFAENLLMNAMLEDPSVSDREKARILDIEVGHGAVYLLDIPVRYEFEKAFYEERAQGPLSVTRLKELMAATQHRVLGEILERGGEDSYFWASKLHFYITGITFYNFPYTFGYLLSRGLYARFKNEGPDFLPKYEEFLRLAGSARAETVVRQTLEQNIEEPEFWSDAIKSLEERLHQLEALLPEVVTGRL